MSDNGWHGAARVLYEDGRPYTVPDSLEELTGPIGGVVELPLLLDWSEQGRYDLSDERQRNLMYESCTAAAGGQSLSGVVRYNVQ